MRNWMRRHDEGCFYLALFTLLLAIFEYLFVTRFITNAPHNDLDLFVVTLVAAPLAAGFVVFLFQLTGKIILLFIPQQDR